MGHFKDTNKLSGFLDLDFRDWLYLREQSKDINNKKLCYCGHCYKCTCKDPTLEQFEIAVGNKFIELNDIENGWVEM